MALFADKGIDDSVVVSSFGIRELIRRAGSVIAPLLGGWLTYEISVASVFYRRNRPSASRLPEVVHSG